MTNGTAMSIYGCASTSIQCVKVEPWLLALSCTVDRHGLRQWRLTNEKNTLLTRVLSTCAAIYFQRDLLLTNLLLARSTLTRDLATCAVIHFQRDLCLTHFYRAECILLSCLYVLLMVSCVCVCCSCKCMIFLVLIHLSEAVRPTPYFQSANTIN